MSFNICFELVRFNIKCHFKIKLQYRIISKSVPVLKNLFPCWNIAHCMIIKAGKNDSVCCKKLDFQSLK